MNYKSRTPQERLAYYQSMLPKWDRRKLGWIAYDGKEVNEEEREALVKYYSNKINYAKRRIEALEDEIRGVALDSEPKTQDWGERVSSQIPKK